MSFSFLFREKLVAGKIFLLFLLVFFCSVFLWVLVFGLGENGLFGNWELIKAIFYFESGILAAFICYRFENFLDSYWEKSFLDGDNGSRGSEGEEKVMQKIKEVYGPDYKVYKNFKIPGRKWDIDFVIIGPKGVLVLEVKNYTGQMSFYHKYVIKKIKKASKKEEEFHLMGKNDPRNQLIYHTAIFDQYIGDLGFGDIKINKALVFPEDIVKINENPGIKIISGLSGLNDFLNNLEKDEKFTPEFCQRLDEAFKNAWGI